LLLILGITFTMHELPCKPAVAAPEIIAAENSMPTPATESSLFDEVMDSLETRYVDVIDKVAPHASLRPISLDS
jgi:hypothetical protein